VDGFALHDSVIKTSYGTTKYCTFYVRDMPCNNTDCLYLHSRANPSDVISRVHRSYIGHSQKQRCLQRAARLSAGTPGEEWNQSAASKTPISQAGIPKSERRLAETKRICLEDKKSAIKERERFRSQAVKMVDVELIKGTRTSNSVDQAKISCQNRARTDKAIGGGVPCIEPDLQHRVEEDVDAR
jgi:hypothetical protein